MRRAIRTAILLFALPGAVLPGAARAEAACAPDRLDLRWPGGGESFAVEIADDADERAQGLMFRDGMAADRGMLFVYEGPRHARFWMKNTLIPLDMIFADASGTVTRVHSDAVPGDLAPVDGGEGVVYVLEINGGLAGKLGIAPGTELRHPAIPAATAAWPCDG